MSDAGSIATKCLAAWTSGDFATARSLLRDDMTFAGPLGADRGAEGYMAELERLAPLVTGADQKRMMVDGDDACIVYDLVTVSSGPLPTSSWYHVNEGKIASVQAYFDARMLPSVSGPAASRRAVDRLAAERPLIDYLSNGHGVTDPHAIPVFFSAEMEIAEGDDMP